MSHAGKGLGRRHAPDRRDQRFLLATAAPPSDRSYRYWWSGGAWLDQGNTSSCVGHAFAHWLEDGPVTQPNIVADPFAIYDRAQQLDEWEGQDYDGTSVRGGAKALVETDLVESYLWAWDLATMTRAVLGVGPVVVGTAWYERMFDPDTDGLVTIGGGEAGGHAWKVDGVNTDRQLFRAKNSWGRGWGRDGHFSISFADMERLIAEDGEVCCAVERKA